MLNIQHEESRPSRARRRTGLIALAGVMLAIVTGTPVKADNGSFAAISDYTIFEQSLPNGEHPVWVYYLSVGAKVTVVRIAMPTMKMCVVTPQSKRDMDIFTARASHHLVKGSPDWKLAEDLWEIAIKPHLSVGQLQRC